MAEDGTVVEREKGGSAAPVRRKLGMANRIDAAMNPTQAIRLVPTVHMSLREAQLAQLPIRHYPVLLLRQVSQPRM